MNSMVCNHCGMSLTDGMTFCPKCGNKVGSAGGSLQGDRADSSPKSAKIALFLALFFCMFGFHRFYVGKIGTGILMFLTAGGLGIWMLIDLICIVTNRFKDKQDKALIFHTEVTTSKKVISVTAIVLAWIAIFVGFIIALAFYATSGLVGAVSTELEAIKSGNTIKAYALTSQAFQKAVPIERFESFVNQYPALKENKGYFFTNREINNNMGTLSGTLTGKNGYQIPVRFKLIKENGQWKVFSIEFTAPGLK